MKCRICKNDKDNQEYEAQEMMFGLKDTFLYIKCSKCGCLQIKDILNDMSKYYAGDYYSYHSVSNLTNKNKLKKYLIGIRNKFAVFHKGLLGKLLYHKSPNTVLSLLSQVKIKKDTAILDVGCGAGILLYSLRELGFKNLLGIDPFCENDIKYDNGLNILKKGIHDIDGKWDLIMFHHSFEHIPDPEETLLSVHKLLNPGGHCLIRVPTVTSYAWDHYGVNWVQLDAPRHLFLHSVESMKVLARKTNYDLKKIVFDSTAFQFWGSEQYAADIPLRDKRSYGENPQDSMFTKDDITGFVKRANKLNANNQGDQAAFYLKKL